MATPDGRGPRRSVLHEEREFFVRSLRDLEAERVAGDIDDVDYRALRDDYTVRAAEVVRQLAQLDAPVGPDQPETVGPVRTRLREGQAEGIGSALDGVRRMPVRRRRIFVAVAVLIVAGGSAFAVIGEAGSSQSAATRVRDLDVAAQDAIGNQQYKKAVQDYEAALKIEPTDVLTLTGEGELLVEVGSGRDQQALDLGMTRLRSAEIADPSYGPAFGARGIGFYDEGTYAAAVPQFETYLADTPKSKQSSVIVQALASAKKRTAAASSRPVPPAR